MIEFDDIDVNTRFDQNLIDYFLSQIQLHSFLYIKDQTLFLVH